MSKYVDYYASLASPYTYMGGRRLPEIIENTGADFHIKPIMGGQVMAATGGLPVAKRHPARLAYRLVELDRWKRHWSIPMNIQPKFFPVNDSNAGQMVIAARQARQDAIALSNVFLACVWEGEQDISDTATLITAANGAGFDGDGLAAKIGDATVMAEYQANTDEAIEHQVFGMPWFIHEGVPYWGQDRIRFLARALTD
ncbi:MAG: 2-hydroxychromene-2-carboxylate isomerase [Rhodospirillaceae bacterium]|jgi:2-hydroxychromene-2-carboxylate isomerase|nr:2-hydroxychromene-2-carboxylate isomerase [Rhodospirillaceae bacterium]MBT3495029.1 2-hydroxychromene-2-carboxylate isomerase [Rhodospirillaceae bacterium]MBT3781778.1 2-hydroxychromene-2-carboxylate isomerase [Rhodospirillaceae bacterium]MBT3979349.1 2-hydroxychromene-2-carboxylate isomerase [Rhodospirillaceae bacterium]MBT4170660.1 2-hydroxychromene-2-carboxylate isomerase [Rhodospirillaceae bacterium]